MARDLIIIGIAGSGREVAEAVEDVNSLARKWNLLGFLDDDPQKQGKEFNGYPVLGPIGSAVDHPTCQFAVVLGSHRDLGLTKRTVERLSLDSDRFATIIHPDAKVSKYAEIAPGAIILQKSIVTTNTKIGSHALVMFGAAIAHDCTIHHYVSIAPNAVISGNVNIGECCYIGSNAAIIQNVEVGPWSCVGMGSAVFSNVPPHTTVMGNPARPFKDRVSESSAS